MKYAIIPNAETAERLAAGELDAIDRQICPEARRGDVLWMKEPWQLGFDSQRRPVCARLQDGSYPEGDVRLAPGIAEDTDLEGVEYDDLNAESMPRWASRWRRTVRSWDEAFLLLDGHEAPEIDDEPAAGNPADESAGGSLSVAVPESVGDELDDVPGEADADD